MREIPKRCHETPNDKCLGCIAMAIVYTERAIRKAAQEGDVRSETDMAQTVQGLYFEFDGLCGFCGGNENECADYNCQEECV